MIGAILGDTLGSRYEFSPATSYDFELLKINADYTDDSVLSIATMDVILNSKDYQSTYRDYTLKDLRRGYGCHYIQWAESESLEPYNSFGNGSAMRVSPIGWVYDNVEDTLSAAKNSAIVTHNHLEGIKGAQAVALAIYMARTGATKDEIRSEITSRFEYDLSRTVESIRASGYKFDVTCQGSVPESIIAFLDSSDFTSAIRNAIWLGGDADTQAAIAGSIAEAYYKKIDTELLNFVFEKLPQRYGNIVSKFYNVYGAGVEFI